MLFILRMKFIEISTVLALALLINLSISMDYQMWKQCDSRWANNRLGYSTSDTICSAGCLMTSITMAVTSMPTWIEPGGMNEWLKQNGG